MSFADFEAHLKHPAPGFRCYACGDRERNATFLARVQNIVNPPANEEALNLIDQLLPTAATSIKPFYAEHDGVLMYEDTLSTRTPRGSFKAAGVAFFPVEHWQAKSNEMRADLMSMGWPQEEMPDWLQEGIAFGEIPHSANYFVIHPRGENAGKIFYADHDDFQPDPIAASFEAFLDSILTGPADFLYRLGCYTRYSDGETDTQWIPKEYVAG